MKLAWGPVCQLYTRHLYAIIGEVPSLNCSVSITDEALEELRFWQHLPRLRLVGEIRAPLVGLPIRVVTDAIDFAWGVTP